MTQNIRASVFPSRLRLKPGNSRASFEVTVINESNQFAAFQLELIAPGYATDPNRKWYKTEPRVGTKKPPGDKTVFTVSILEAPIPGFVGRVEIMVRVFSLEFPGEVRQPISLDIEPSEAYLILELPAPRLQAYPRNPIEIPVRIYNPRRQVSDVSLNLLGLEASWLPEGGHQQLIIPAGEQSVIHFLCQAPSPAVAPCADYDFTVEAMPADGLMTAVSGILEMLPAGFVEFDCDTKQQQIPKKRRFLISWKSEPVTYKLQLENTSNLWQDIEVKLEGKDQQHCKVELNPETVILDPAEQSNVDLTVKKRRPWLGLARRLLFEAELDLKDTDNINSQVVPNPKSQLLELKVLPIIPPWLQALLALLLLILLWLIINQKPPAHELPVTTVQISGDAGTVLSGSRDQTIRRWDVNGNKLDYEGLLAKTGKAVRVLRYRPVENNIVAAGLENGEIQFWDILSSQNLRTLSFKKDDRVFGLAYTQDSRFIYSGHGSGRILEWNLEDKDNQNRPSREKYVGFTIQAIALSETPGEKLLIIAGRFNQLAIWDLNSNRLYPVNYRHVNNPSTRIAGKEDYIESIATVGSTLATADNQGYITLWNLSDRSCKQSSTATPGSSTPGSTGAGVMGTIATNPSPSSSPSPRGNNPGSNQSSKKPCEIELLDQWNNGQQGRPVRSVALTRNGCYLASTGDDGRVMLWPLSSARRRISEGENVRREIVVDNLNVDDDKKTLLNSVDVIIRQGDILIANDDFRNSIRFYRLREKGLNPFCQ